MDYSINMALSELTSALLSTKLLMDKYNSNDESVNNALNILLKFEKQKLKEKYDNLIFKLQTGFNIEMEKFSND